MHKLEPLKMPLNGVNLIEASAGTGKTYTITTLYLRLLLGLRSAEQIEDGLSVEQILVVTFTEAATEEIRDRVRKRLNEAKTAIFLRNVSSEHYQMDPVLAQLLALLPDPDLAWRRLDAAVKMMDEACIFTIHGFCQRMLKYHAFESGSLFDNQFILDEKVYLLSAVKDFWRRTVYPMSGLKLQLFLAVWATPQKLLKDIQPLLNRQGVKALNIIDEHTLDSAINEYAELSQQVKRLWLDEQIPKLINDSTMMRARKSAKPEYLQAFTEFCLSDDIAFKKAEGWAVWSSEAVAKACKKGTEPPEHKIWALFDRLATLQATLDNDLAAFYKHKAFGEIKQLLLLQKRLEQKISPDDLLEQLALALKHPDKGATLAAKIAAQFPIAMIDEFQDTDPLQYEIFSTIYGVDGASMVMIGDPKQAIYGFRGADIFTYIEAKTQISDTHSFTLDTNWRSSAKLVSAVNGLFAQSPDPFIYNEAIDFYPVNAAASADKKPLSLAHEQDATPLQFWHLCSDDNLPISKTNAQGILAIRCANEIAQLLEKSQHGQAKIGERPLVAGDICVLVRDRNEADVIRQALNQSGVQSVYLSRQSVFETDLAMQFYLLLDAVFQASNEKAIRAALTTAFFGYSFNQLWLLSQNEDDWQGILDLFTQLHQLLFKNGVMAVIQYLLVHLDLAGRWRSQYANVQRLLTDIRHIGELLQQKSLELDGINRLMLWFHEQLLATSDEGKVQQLRLEDDANLVQIVTMHASKGLEYHLVFLPFVCSYRAAALSLFHQDNTQVIDFTNHKDNLAKADKERLAEDLRLLYVALTRAVHRCYVGVFNLKVGNSKASQLLQTALGHLLFHSLQSIDDSSIAERLGELCQSLNQSGKICALETITADILPYRASLTNTQAQAVVFHEFNGKIEQDWRVTSYSALAHGVGTIQEKPGGTDEGEIIVPQETTLGVNLHNRFGFPKGANAGSCLHEILENITFTEFVKDNSDDAVIVAALNKYGIDEGFAPVVEQWMVSVLNTRLNRQGLKLNQIEQTQCLIEMEFYLPISRLSPREINQLLSLHLARKVEAFRFANLQGILKGYVDLIFCHQGQYFVLDYKSNHLGERFDDYDKTNMSEAMDAHHYHLQYLLYSLALHRYLQNRLKNYDYDRHFGGCYYLFLRGMDERNSHFQGVYFNRPQRSVIDMLDGLFAKGALSQPELGSPEQLGLFGG